MTGRASLGNKGWGKDSPRRGTEGGTAHARSHPQHKQVPHGSVHPRGPGPAQGRGRELRTQSRSQYLCEKILNGQDGKINSPSHLFLIGRAVGAADPMRNQRGGSQRKAFKEATPFSSRLRGAEQVSHPYGPVAWSSVCPSPDLSHPSLGTAGLHLLMRLQPSP